MRWLTCAPATLLLLFCCTIETPETCDANPGVEAVINGVWRDGDGVVFRDTDSTLRLRLLMGTRMGYYQGGMTLKHCYGGMDSVYQDSATDGHLTVITGMDMVGPGYEMVAESCSTHVVLNDVMSAATGTFVYLGVAISGDTARLSATFDLPIGAVGNTSWDCDFEDECIRNCGFM